MILASWARASTCENLMSLAVPSTVVVSASPVAERNKPVFCKVALVARPVADSEIHVEIWLPEPRAWNGKFVGNGNGGYSGQIGYRAMQSQLDQDYAVAGSDTGHSGEDLKFAVGHREKIDDWAYRAVHVMTEAAGLVLRSYYGRFPAHSYFVGCSTGGQQALSEAQRYPTDYDGIIAGDPGHDRIHLNVGFLWSWLAANDDPKARLPSSKLPYLNRAVIAACDALDGIQDGVIDDPRHCHFDPQSLVCAGTETDACLTPAQAAAVKKIYEGAHNPRTGERLFPGWVRGSEALSDGSGGWSAYFVGKPEPARLDFWRYWIFGDPNWNFHTFDFDRDVAYADSKLAMAAALDPDLSRFKANHGRLLLYHGWADPVAPPEGTIAYFETVERTLGGHEKLTDFMRLFMVPGMGHCQAGPGPNTFDALGALDHWVTAGTAPDRILASHTNRGAIDRTRPLCPYPQVAKWKGTGSTDDAANFACSVALSTP